MGLTVMTGDVRSLVNVMEHFPHVQFVVALHLRHRSRKLVAVVVDSTYLLLEPCFELFTHFNLHEVGA